MFPLTAAALALAASLAPPSGPSSGPTITFSAVIHSIEGQDKTIVHLTDADTGQAWAMEASTRNTFNRVGLDPDHPGDAKVQVTAVVLQDKNCAGECRLHMRTITFADGRKVFLGAPR